MKLIAVTCDLPYPLDTGSKIRNFHLLQEIAREHSIRLISLARREPSADAVAALSKFCSSVQVIPNHRSNFRKAADLVRSFVTGTPYIVLANTNRALSEAVAKTLDAESVDVLYVSELYGAHNLAPLKTTPPLIFDAHNCEATILAQTAQTASNPFARIYYRLQAKWIGRFERDFAASASAVFAVSERERSYFAGFANRVALVPNGVPSVEAGNRIEARKSVLFTGTLAYPPNRDALEYFLQEIWPLVAQRLPNLQFIVIGRDPPQQLLEYSSASVVFLPDVDNIQPYFASAAVLAVPLRSGAGTRLKVLQAFANGLPVVSTTIGAEGIEAVDGKEILLRDDPVSFADAIVASVTDRPLAQLLADNARNRITERYLWSRIAAQPLESIRAVVS